MKIISSGVIGSRNLESRFESESTLVFLNPNPDSYFLAQNPNIAQKALIPDSNLDSDSHITGVSRVCHAKSPLFVLHVYLHLAEAFCCT